MNSPAYIEGTTIRGKLGIYPERQTQVGTWIAEGKEDPDMAIIIGISRYTVKEHVNNLMRTLDCHTRSQLVAKLFVKGVLSARTLALLLSCSVLTGIVAGGDINQPFRVRGGSRITTRINRPLQIHTGA